MAEIIGVLGLCIGGISIYLCLSIHHELKSINKQLEAIWGQKTNQKIRIGARNKQIRQLVTKVNQILEEENMREVIYRKKDRELRQMVANVSHDLRTPLTSIIGYMQLLEDRMLSEEDREKYLGIVKRRAYSLQVLISSFYDLSRIEAKEYTIELKSINISTTICELIASYYNDFVDKNLEPIFEIDENCPKVIGDDKAVERVINNLIQNSIRYAEGNFKVRVYNQQEFVITEFRNKATNLSEEDVEHLFERFYTVDRMRTGQNTGLGLTISKKLVEQMGHEITAELKDGQLVIQIRWKKMIK